MKNIILTNTLEELETATVPAICVIGATSTEVDGKKVYIRTCLINEACERHETKLWRQAVFEGREEKRMERANFLEERMRLVFEGDGGFCIGKYKKVIILGLVKGGEG